VKNKRGEEDTIKTGKWEKIKRKTMRYGEKIKVGNKSNSITLVTIMHTVCEFPLCKC